MKFLGRYSAVFLFLIVETDAYSSQEPVPIGLLGVKGTNQIIARRPLHLLPRQIPALRETDGKEGEHDVSEVSWTRGIQAFSGKDGSVRLSEMTTGRTLYQYSVGGKPVYSLAFSPDGSSLASGGIGSIVVWSVDRGQPIHELSGHLDRIHAIKISPDGKALASADRETSRTPAPGLKIPSSTAPREGLSPCGPAPVDPWSAA
jgi:hypothetical protein